MWDPSHKLSPLKSWNRVWVMLQIKVAQIHACWFWGKVIDAWSPWWDKCCLVGLLKKKFCLIGSDGTGTSISWDVCFCGFTHWLFRTLEQPQLSSPIKNWPNTNSNSDRRNKKWTQHAPQLGSKIKNLRREEWVFWVNIIKSEFYFRYRNYWKLFKIVKKESEFWYHHCRNSTKNIREKKKKGERENAEFR